IRKGWSSIPFLSSSRPVSSLARPEIYGPVLQHLAIRTTRTSRYFSHSSANGPMRSARQFGKPPVSDLPHDSPVHRGAEKAEVSHSVRKAETSAHVGLAIAAHARAAIGVGRGTHAHATP